MKVLGINFSHDAALSFIENGEIKFSIEEEKTSRVKQEFGWPKTAWATLSEQYRVKPEDIDVIAFGSKFYSSISKNEIRYRFSKNSTDRNKEILNRLTTYMGLTTKRISEANKDVFRSELKKLGFTKAKVVFKGHHISHAASAFYAAPFQTDLIITCDGHGDGDAFMFYKPTDKGLELLHGINYEASIGQFYSGITQLLGFRPTRHEGKITGLAAYGKPGPLVQAFRDLFFKEGDDLRRFPYGQREEMVEKYKVQDQINLKEKINMSTSESEIGFLYGLNSKVLLEHLKEITAGHTKEDIAFACQAIAEEIVIQECNAVYGRFFAGKQLKVSLAGGVFANVRINQKIYELAWCENLFVQPAMGDSGLSLGGALLADIEESKRDPLTRDYAFTDTYWGPEYSDGVRKALDEVDASKFEITEMSAPAQTIAEYLMDNQVIGLWHGKMEWGPRALGMRSMILNTFDKSVNDSVNQRLSRTEFMPFAPSIIDYKIKEYIPKYDASCPAADYMTITYDVAPEHHEMLQAVVHVDGTARPQVVRKETNPYYYEIIEAFDKISGCGAIVNTSFNAHEEPIVSTPEVALKALYENRIDILVLDKYLIRPKK